MVEIKDKEGNVVAIEHTNTLGEAIKFANDNQQQGETVTISIFYMNSEGKPDLVEPVIMWSDYEYHRYA